MALMKGSQALAECLLKMGAERIYGIIGTSIIGFVDALYDVQDKIRYISCRHEQVAASMADTEGRLSGKPGVVLAHSGPGALNTIISLTNAYKDCSPVIAIFGAVKRRLKGKDGMLEVDHTKIFAPVCKGTYRVEDAPSIPVIFSEAYQTAMKDAKGPVIIEVPEDVWSEIIEVDMSKLNLKVPSPPEIGEEDIKEIINSLEASNKPIILAGAGIAYTHSSEELIKLAETLNLPVITTGNGRGTIPENHPLCLGRAGFGGGNTVADTAFQNADLVLGIGCTISDMTTYEFIAPPSGEVILINLDPHVEKKGLYVKKHIYGDAGDFLKKINKLISPKQKKERKEWFDSLNSARKYWQDLIGSCITSEKSPLSPGRVCHLLDKMLPEDAIMTAGMGMHVLYPNTFINIEKPLTFLSAVNFGAMGFGFPAGLTAKLLYPKRTVISILGDGDFMMTVQDMETAKREGINLKVFVFNDNSYRVLTYRQKLSFQGRILGSLHTNPNFVKLAEAFGAKGLRMSKPEEIEPVLKEALASEELTLTEVVCDPEDMAPTNIDCILRMSM